MIGGVKTTTLILLLACSLAAQQSDKEMSSPIVSDVACTATLGMPTCFPHNDLIDWSKSNVVPIVIGGTGPIIAGYVSGEPNLTFILSGLPGFTSFSAPGSCIPGVSADCSGTDTLAAWTFGDRNMT